MNFKLAAFGIVVFGVLSRLLPHQPNISPIGALALFGGVYLPKKFAFLPLVILLISDFFIGFYGIDMLYVYGSFTLIGLIGLWLKGHKNPLNIVGSSLVSSVLFYLITNFGVWAPPNNWYSHTATGLMQSYFAALPFFRNTVLGDLGYTVFLFGGYEVVKRLSRKFLPERIYQMGF